MKHCAFNIVTGEIHIAPNGKTLKKMVKFSNRIAKEFNYPIGQWRFGHQGMEKLTTRLGVGSYEIIG